MGRPVVHWELWSKEPERVANFYAKVFDWKVNFYPEMNYRMVETGGTGGINGGIFQPQQGGPWPGTMAFYVDVDDIAAAMKSIVAAGGKVLVERQEVPGMGAFGLFEDPEGRVMGVWQQSPGGG
jgi:predicted enzyme related to lactoylglutathione lyase